MHVGLSERFRERNELGAAMQHLQASTELGEQASGRQNLYRWHVAMARIRDAEGDPDTALDLLDEAERVYVGDFYPMVRPIHALKARIWIAQGKLDRASAWVRTQGVSVEDDLSYMREFDHITLIRSLLAGPRTDGTDRSVHDALGLLDRLLEAAEAGGRGRSVIEILVLQALARDASGDRPGAVAALDRAVVLAEPEGFVRIIVDEGPAVASLLKATARDASRPAYVAHLLTALGEGPDRAPPSTGTRRATQRAGARRASAARDGPGRTGHRARTRGVPAHGPGPHQEHLREARRDQPPGSRPPSPGARPVVASREPVTGTRGRSSIRPMGRRACRRPEKSPHVGMPAHHIRS